MRYPIACYNAGNNRVSAVMQIGIGLMTKSTKAAYGKAAESSKYICLPWRD